jgi:hypothetical protein
MECMLRWDIKKQTSKGKGTLGKVVAFSAHGRKTLQRHWQIWVTEKIKHYKIDCFMKTLLREA